MKKKKFIEDLDKLHQDMTKFVVDNENNIELSGLHHDIKNILEDPGSFSFDHAPIFVDKVSEFAKKVEISHPKLTTLAEQVISSLNAMGI